MIRQILMKIGMFLRGSTYALPGIGPSRARRRWPRVDGALDVDGLRAPVEILRDAWGVPHLYGEHERDVVFAQGFVHAQDRLWQIDFGRRIASGTLAAAIGPRGVPVDRLMRTLGLREVAERWWAESDPETRALLEAYAAGVNAALAPTVEHDVLGLAPASFTPVDALLRGTLFAYMLGGNHRLELLRARLAAEAGEDVASLLLPRSAPGTPLIVPGPLDGLDAVDRLLGDPNIVSGSNNWVVHGRRTASGKPLLANDVHIGLGLPGQWYECGLHGDGLDVVGFSLPGVPFVVIGHNGRVAWGMSNLGPDTQDFYVERVEGGRYAFEGAWHDLEVRRETIAVRGGAPVAIEVRRTRHGPILNEAMGAPLAGAEPLALRWSLDDCGALVAPLRAMNRAADCASFRAALARWDAPGQNFVFADTAGHIGYQATGRIPVRAPGHLGVAPVPGWTGEFEWRGWIPFEALPAASDPPAGFVATANNKVTADDDPHLIAWNWFPGYRARRIVDLLAAGDRHSVEDMRRIQTDTYSVLAEAVRPALASVAPGSDLERRAHAAVMAWDLRFETDRVGATVYQAFYVHLLRRLLARKLGAEAAERYLASEYERHGSLHAPLVVALLGAPDDPWWGGARDATVRDAFAAAVAWLAKRYGRDPARWAWGRVHTLTLGHAPLGGLPLLRRVFNSRPGPARGDNYTVDGASFVWSRPFVVVHGTAQRMVIDLADLSRSVGVHLAGQSGHLHHPHREDQLAMSRRLEVHPILHAREAVEAHARHRLTLRPRTPRA